jgi:undecaprenyl-diphosphatase 1
LYWNRLWPIKKVDGRPFIKLGTIRLWTKIIIACIPAAIIGIAFDDLIDEYFYKPQMVAAALLVVGIIFIYIENRLNPAKNTLVAKLSEITYKDALIIGIFQLLAAIFPGTSRSGATIIGGLLLGLSRKTAAEFTFFLAIPVMFGASLLKTVKYMVSGGALFSGTEIAILITGVITALVVSFLAIGFLMNYVKKKNFKPFGWYRIGLSIFIVIYTIITKS